jgi:hypothetical protein
MDIASARALKEEIKNKILPSVMKEIMQPRRLAIAATAIRPAPLLQQRTIALGIVPAPKGQAKLAIRVQRQALMPDAERIAEKAKGEADIRYIGRVSKRQIPWYQTRQRPLAIGISVGHFKITAGTLGCFVRPTRGGPHILSNNHVLANENRAKRGDAIIQAGRFDGGLRPRDVIAKLAKFVTLKPGQANLVDCAIATLRDTFEFNRTEIRDLGALAGVRTAPVDDGTTVHKHGRTTGLTHGRVTAIELDDVTVAFDEGNLSFDDQIEIEGSGDLPFSDGGDSGSLIVDDSLHAVGLLFAGGDQGGSNGRGLTYANPIATVLDQLGVTLLT